MVFFAKNRKKALERLKRLQKEDNFYNRFKTVRLARRQIPHIDNFKTWMFK